MSHQPPVDRLTARWDAVPPERQEMYRRIYQRELRQAGATTDDAAELAVLRRLIKAYQEQALVPAGSRWVSVPERVREAARKNQPLHESENDRETAIQSRSRAALFVLLPLFGLLFAALLLWTGGESHEQDTLTASATPTLTPTATLEISPTPTPLALEESDQVIEAGENSRRDYFPVLLQIYPSDGSPARVFVVQERAVNTADWRFDPNPDVVSWVSGLLVRPVLGLPHSDENESLLSTLQPGARFALQMNTGATLDFVYANTQRVMRQDADVFRQIEPGVALILIGEMDENGLLTDERLVVTGHYPAEQEVERLRSGDLQAAVLPGQPAAIDGIAGLQITVLNTELLVPGNLPENLAYALVNLDITTGADTLRTSRLRWLLEDAAGNRYSPDANTDDLPFAALPGDMPPHTGLQTSLGFLVPRTLDDARLLVSTGSAESATFALTFTPPPAPVTVDDLDVQIRQAAFDNDAVYINARIFNPLDEPVSLADETLWLITGYTPSPTGPQIAPVASDLPQRIEAGTAFNLNLTFPYSSEPYARLHLLNREYALQLAERR